jgi:ABC-type transporter Mla subunit MlaD
MPRPFDMNEHVMTAFVIVAAAAIIFQAILLMVLFFAFRKTSQRVEAIATNVESKAIPLLDTAKTILDENGPRLKEITQNLSETTSTLKTQMTRVDATLNDVLDRTRLQVIRVDDMVSRTMDKVEETTEMLQHTVVSPVKKLTGIMQGLSVGLGAYIQRRRKATMEAVTAVEDDELFI